MKPVSADGELGSCGGSACVRGSSCCGCGCGCCGCGCDDTFAIKKIEIMLVYNFYRINLTLSPLKLTRVIDV